MPHSSALGELHFEEQKPCNGEKESGKPKVMQRRRRGRCHHKQRHAREISPNVGRDPLLAHWRNPILHSDIYRNGVHTTRCSQFAGRQVAPPVTVRTNETNPPTRPPARAKIPL